MTGKIEEFANYTRHLNAAAGDASSYLRRAHPEEYERYLAERMSALGYVRNPRGSFPGERSWIRKES